jgi:hypothetical protein
MVVEKAIRLSANREHIFEEKIEVPTQELFDAVH